MVHLTGLYAEEHAKREPDRAKPKENAGSNVVQCDERAIDRGIGPAFPRALPTGLPDCLRRDRQPGRRAGRPSNTFPEAASAEEPRGPQEESGTSTERSSRT